MSRLKLTDGQFLSIQMQEHEYRLPVTGSLRTLKSKDGPPQLHIHEAADEVEPLPEELLMAAEAKTTESGG